MSLSGIRHRRLLRSEYRCFHCPRRFALHVSGVRRLVSREPITRLWVELLFMTARLGGYLTLVFLVLSPDKAVVFLAIQIGLFGVYMGSSFAPNHKGCLNYQIEHHLFPSMPRPHLRRAQPIIEAY
jgi:fatty acid desaturase